MPAADKDNMLVVNCPNCRGVMWRGSSACGNCRRAIDAPPPAAEQEVKTDTIHSVLKHKKRRN